MAIGKFICLEGTDGSGKSTHSSYILESLARRGHKAVFTHEPGGSYVADRLAELLIHCDQEEIFPQTELLLFFAARCQHLRHFIIPQLEQGNWVVSDRFIASSYAYQGGGHSLGASKVAELESYLPKLKPDLTFIFDISLEEAMKRRKGEDRFESKDREFFVRVRSAYLEFARQHQGCFVLDTGQSRQQVRELIDEQLDLL